MSDINEALEALPSSAHAALSTGNKYYFTDGVFFESGRVRRHRHGPADKPRCKSTYEMRAAGFEQDSRGYWRKPQQGAPKEAA